MHVPKKFTLPNIFALATRRGVKAKAVVITTALVCTLFSGFAALAGQGPSQYCSDGGWSDIPVINDPVTIGVEIGPSTNNPSWGTVCYSTTPNGSGATEVTGGDVRLDAPGQNGTNAYCVSDPAAMVRLDCYSGVGLNTSNPTAPSANASYGTWINVLGTPISAPSVGAGTGCAGGTVAVSISSCANAEILGISGLGNASGQVAIGGTGATGQVLGVSPFGTGAGMVAIGGYDGWGSLGGAGNHGASGSLLAVAINGCATSSAGVAISGTCGATGGLVGIAGTGTGVGTVGIGGYDGWGGLIGIGNHGASGSVLAVSGEGCPNSSGGVAASGTSCAYGAVAGISGTGTANSYGSGVIPGVAISGGNFAYGRDVAISGIGAAQGSDGSNKASLLNVSGGAGETWVGDELLFLDTGLLNAPTHEDNVIDMAYMPPAEAIAIKEQAAALLLPWTTWNIANGVNGPEEGGSQTRSHCPGNCPPPSKMLSSIRDDGQDYCNSCVPASVRTILLQLTGSAPSENELINFMGTGRSRVDTPCGRSGTPLPAAAKALNRTDQNGNRMYQNIDTFVPHKPKDAADYINKVTMVTAYMNHGVIQAVNPARLNWFLKKDGNSIDRPAVSDGSHANATYGYGHHGGAHVHVIEVWNPLKLKWSQQRINNTFGPNRNPYGEQTAKLAEMWTAITQEKNADGKISGIVW